MKYTDIEIKDLIYKLIKASDIPKRVTGKVYKVLTGITAPFSSKI